MQSGPIRNSPDIDGSCKKIRSEGFREIWVILFVRFDERTGGTLHSPEVYRAFYLQFPVGNGLLLLFWGKFSTPYSRPPSKLQSPTSGSCFVFIPIVLNVWRKICSLDSFYLMIMRYEKSPAFGGRAHLTVAALSRRRIDWRDSRSVRVAVVHVHSCRWWDCDCGVLMLLLHVRMYVYATSDLYTVVITTASLLACLSSSSSRWGAAPPRPPLSYAIVLHIGMHALSPPASYLSISLIYMTNTYAFCVYRTRKFFFCWLFVNPRLFVFCKISWRILRNLQCHSLKLDISLFYFL